MLTLDAGCGAKPRGDVNCDLFVGKSPHTKFVIRKTRNFIRCDAHCLPFKDRTFEVVYSSHLIEHLTCPFMAIKEFSRVSKRYVYIKIPNTAIYLKQRKEHLYGWDKFTFRQFLSQVFPKVKVYCASEEFLHGRILDHMGGTKKIFRFSN